MNENDGNEKGHFDSKTGGNHFFSKKLKRNPEALPLMNGGLKDLLYSLCLFQKENWNYISHEISKEINVFPHSNAPIPTKETLDQPQNILTFFTHRVHSVLPLGLCYG